MTPTTRTPLGWLLAALGLLATPAIAPAQDFTFWIPQTGGNWFDPANWDNGLPNSSGAWARFGWTGTGSQTVIVDGTATVGRMTFGFLGNESSTSDFAYTLSGGSIILDNGLADSIIERSKTDGNTVIQTQLTIAGNNALTLRNAGFTGGSALGTLTIASLTGTNSTVTVNPSGTTSPGVVVIESGSYGGITHVQGGVLRAAEGVGLPADTSLRLNGGGWELPSATTITRSLGTGAGQIQMLGLSGFTAFNGQVTIRLNNGTGQVQWGSVNFNPTILQFGRGVTAGGHDNYVFENGLDLNGAVRTVRVGVGAGVRATARFTGNIVNTSGTASGLTIGGAGGGGGVVELSGTNTYNGRTTVSGLTTLRANEGAGLSPNSDLFLNGGILEGLGATTFSRPLGTTPGAVRLTGLSGFSASGGTHTIQLDGGTGTVVWGSPDFTPSTLQLGSFTADAMTDFQNGLDLNAGGRFVSVRDNPNSTVDVGRISGVISGGSNTVAFFGGNGTLELTGANTYAGRTLVVDSPALSGTVVKLVGSGSFANSIEVTVDAGRFLDVTGLTGGANYHAGSARFMVAAEQTLAGSGTVVGNVLVGPLATIRGGSPTGVLNQPTGQLTINGSLRLIGTSTAPAGSILAVDLDGTSASGATVSRVAVIGAGNTWDFAPAAGDLVTIQLLNDQNLTLNQHYSYIIGSSAGGFTRNGTPVTSFTYGTDFDIVSSNFQVFTNVSLTVDGSNNLVLGFVPAPVPEPALVLAIGAAGLALVRSRRKGKPE